MTTPPTHAACLTRADLDAVPAALERGEFFWLDLLSSSDHDIAQAGDLLGIHPLAVEDSQHFGQRPKFEQYKDHCFLVVFGGAPQSDPDRLVEVHVYFTDRFLVTIRRDESPEIDTLHKRVVRGALSGHLLLHALLDTLVDSFVEPIDDLDGELEAIESSIFAGKLKDRETEIYQLRRRLSELSRILHRQRDLFSQLISGIALIEGFDTDFNPYFRDVRDHLWRMSDAVDVLRDRTGGAIEIYLAVSSNRQNIVMKQFTVIAGVFLPLNVIVGFFGMNFAYQLQLIRSPWAFWILGVLAPLAIISGLLLVFRTRGWLKDQS